MDVRARNAAKIGWHEVSLEMLYDRVELGRKIRHRREHGGPFHDESRQELEEARLHVTRPKNVSHFEGVAVFLEGTVRQKESVSREAAHDSQEAWISRAPPQSGESPLRALAKLFSRCHKNCSRSTSYFEASSRNLSLAPSARYSVRRGRFLAG